MATVTGKSGNAHATPEIQNPIKTVEVSDPVAENPKEEEKVDVTTAGATTGTAEPVSSILKKIKRAERFGMPVQLSEEEKRNTRAERFGTGTNTQGSNAVPKLSDAVKKAEELKRKARAERFGIPSESAADEEAKKKARLARFAPAGKPDSAEDDKRKARALRFAQTSAPTLTHANGEGNIELEAAVVGKASGGA